MADLASLVEAGKAVWNGVSSDRYSQSNIGDGLCRALFFCCKKCGQCRWNNPHGFVEDFLSFMQPAILNLRFELLC